MKNYLNIILVAFSLTATLSSVAQKNKEEVIEVPDFKYDSESKLIVYEGVVEAKGSQSEIFDRALSWMKTYYKNPTDVIKENDPASGKLLGKARFRIYDEVPKSDQKALAGFVLYDITIMCKDSRFKYEITRINWKKSSYFGIEKWAEENKKSYSKSYASYLVQSDEEIKGIIDSLKDAVVNPAQEKKDEW